MQIFPQICVMDKIWIRFAIKERISWNEPVSLMGVLNLSAACYCTVLFLLLSPTTFDTSSNVAGSLPNCMTLSPQKHEGFCAAKKPQHNYYGAM